METGEPQTHRCSKTNGTPRRHPTAKLSSSLARCKPKFGDGREFNHEPDEGELLAKNFALPPASSAASNAVNCAEQI